MFICPSLQDNLPNTVLEAMVCGTPVIGYDTGGLPDMIEDGQSGYLAGTPGDVESLVSALEQTLAAALPITDPASNSARSLRTRYSLDMQAASYRALYDSLNPSCPNRKRSQSHS